MSTDQLDGVVEGMSSDGHGNGEEVWSINHGNNNNNWRNDEATGPSGHFSSPEQLQSPPPLQHHHQPQPQLQLSFVNDEGFDYRSPVQIRLKKVKFSHQNSEEEEIVDDSEGSSQLGLTLNKSPSFIDLVERKLSEGRMSTSNTPTRLDSCNCDRNQRPIPSRSEDYGSQPMSEKLKASNFPALLLKIGTWERISKHEGDLVAKCYYAKRKLVWEILEGALKSKIEIQWTDIVGIRATLAEDEPGLLEIELDKEPSYYRETNPQPRKHTLWQQTKDFTEGQAAKFRIHHVRFAPGVLDKHYEKLLQCHPKLKELSQEPFPSKPILYFEEKGLHGFLDLDLNGFGGAPYYGGLMPYLTIPQGVPQAFRIFDSNPQMSANNMMVENGRIIYWGDTSHGIQAAPRPPLVLPSTQVDNMNFPSNVVTHHVGPRMSNIANNGQLSYIENHLLSDHNNHNQTFSSADGGSMQPLFHHFQMVNSRIGEEQVIMQQDANAAASTSSHNWDFGQEMMMQQVPIHSPQTSTMNLTYSYPLSACYMHEKFSNHNM